MLTTLHGHLKTQFHDTFNLRTGIDIRIVSFVIILISLTKVHATRQFAQHHEISPTNQLVLQRRLVKQAIESSHRTHIGKQAEFLTHGQQACFGTHLRRRIMIVLQIAHSGKKYGIRLHADLMGRIRIRISHLIDGMGTTDGFLIGELVATFSCNGIQHSHTLFHNLRTDTVARKNGNIQFHNSLLCSFSMMFNILKVALIAASVWSASRPRVRNSLPLSFQVMTVCTNASVRPPGGMVTA